MLVGASSVQGQKILSLENIQKFKRITFHKGDFIRFRMKEDKTDYNGHIQEISDSMIVVAKNVQVPGENIEGIRTVRNYVPIKEIGMVYYAPRTYARMMRMGYYRSTLVTGGILIGGSSINTLVTGQIPERRDFLLAAGILGSGLLAKFAGKDVYKIKDNNGWRLRVMESMGGRELSRATP